MCSVGEEIKDCTLNFICWFNQATPSQCLSTCLEFGWRLVSVIFLFKHQQQWYEDAFLTKNSSKGGFAERTHSPYPFQRPALGRDTGILAWLALKKRNIDSLVISSAPREKGHPFICLWKHSYFLKVDSCIQSIKKIISKCILKGTHFPTY